MDPHSSSALTLLRQYELYYVADSAHLESTRAKSKRGNELSLSRTIRPSLCVDSLPLSAIQSKAIISSTSVAKSCRLKKNADAVPTFLVRKVFDACPPSNGEFISGIDWDDLYAIGMKQKIWDTEPIAGSDEVAKPSRKKVKKTPVKQRATLRERDASDDDESEEDEVGNQNATGGVKRSIYVETDSDSDSDARVKSKPRVDVKLNKAREAAALERQQKKEAARLEKKATKAKQKSIAAAAMRESSDEESEVDDVPMDEDEVSFPSLRRFDFR